MKASDRLGHQLTQSRAGLDLRHGRAVLWVPPVNVVPQRLLILASVVFVVVTLLLLRVKAQFDVVIYSLWLLLLLVVKIGGTGGGRGLTAAADCDRTWELDG